MNAGALDAIKAPNLYDFILKEASFSIPQVISRTFTFVHNRPKEKIKQSYITRIKSGRY